MALDSTLFKLASLLPAWGPRAGIPVLCYHEVVAEGEPSADRFAVSASALRAHLAIAQTGTRRVLPLDTLGSGAATSGVLLTFDDNLPSHISRALPVLKSAGVSAVFFLSPADLGRPGQMTRQDVTRLTEAGMFIGAHGNHHVTAITRNPTAFTADVQACARFLLSLGMPLSWAYPGGHLGSFTAHHERILSDHGFLTRFSTLEGLCRPEEPERIQGRYVIRRDSSPRYVQAALRGGLQLVTLLKLARARYALG